MESETRIKAREALLAALDGEPTSSDKLIAVASDIRNLAQKGFSLESITREYSLYAGFLEAAARLSSWTKAVRSCEADADRFLRGAKVLVRDHVQAFQPEKDEMWTSCSDLIEKLSEVGNVPAIYKAVLSIPLPIAHPVQHRRRAPVEVGEKKKVHKVLVAFTSFSVNGEPFQKDHLLNLDIGYDLQVEVGLSTWPEDESELHIEPLSVEPADSYELPSFSFLKPQVAGALSLKATKRMILKRANSFLARPLEFAYRARFPSSREITTEGQRHLSVRCFDPKKDPVSGYEQVDHKFLTLRDVARRATGINDNDLNSLLILMGAVGGIAGQAMQDNLFGGPWTEEEFQNEMKRLLRSYPRIGSEFEEHPHVSGGITDLSFRHIRLELKVIDEHYVTRDDLLQFLPQTVQYVAGSDKRFGVLCVLDASVKDGVPGSVADDISYEAAMGPSGTGLPIGIGTVIIRGNLSKPSTLRIKKRPSRH
ncbi:MAG: hypothetical protein WA623_10460 [Candidatus Sulfotelmatobacter sp.]